MLATSDDVADRLLEGAAARFVEVGVTKTTMAEIAAAAGVTKPTLYRRYADKPAVVDALVRRETAAFASRLARVAATEPDAAAALEAAFAAAVRWLDRHPFLRRSLALEPQLLVPLLTKPGGPVLEAGLSAFRAIVERGVRDGQLRVADVDMVAEVWWRLVLSYVLTPSLGVRRTDAAALRTLARETLLEGLVAR
jgi:TetR/AcrR family transcriptional repressor of uid operon